MTLGLSPGIHEDFGAVRSSTTPSGDAPDGAAAPGGAKAGLFDDLVEAWLAPAADEDDADEFAEAVPAGVVPPFPITRPLPVIAQAPQAQSDAPEAVDGECANACDGASPEPQPSVALALQVAVGVAVDPAPVQRIEAAAPSPRTEGESAQETPPSGAPAVSAPVQAATTADAGADDQRVSDVHELPGLPSVTPSGRVPARDLPTNEGVDVAVPAKESAQATTVGDPIPPPRAVTVLTDGANQRSSAPSLESESISPAPAADAGVPANDAHAGVPTNDAVVNVATERESAKSFHASAQKPAPREAGVPHRPAEKPNVPPAKGDVVRKSGRVPSKIDPRSAGSGAPKSAKTPIAQSSEATPRAMEAVTSLAIDDASSPVGEDSVGQDVASADPPRRLSNLRSPREPLTPSAVDAVAVRGSIPEVHARSIVPTGISTAREASNSGEPQPVDGARGSKGVLTAQPDGRGRSETSDQRDRQANHDANRDADWRDSTDRTQGIARSNLSPAFVEPADSRESTASPSQPVRASVTLVHGSAPVITQATTLFQPLTAAGSDAAPATPAPDTADRIVQSLKLQVQRGGGDAVLHLEPEHLGPVAISLRVENGAVSAVITAEHPAVAEWLQSNQQSLREGLQASGLNLERFVVQRDGQSPSDRQRREWVESRRRDFRRRPSQSNSTFEISM